MVCAQAQGVGRIYACNWLVYEKGTVATKVIGGIVNIACSGTIWMWSDIIISFGLRREGERGLSVFSRWGGEDVDVARI